MASSTTEPPTNTTQIETSTQTPTPAEQSLRLQIRALTEQLEVLEGIVKSDNTIGIKGISHLRNPSHSNGTWDERLHGLFFDARIPLAWFYDMIPAENETLDSDIEFAYVYFINEACKNESVRRLKLFLQIKYPNYEVNLI